MSLTFELGGFEVDFEFGFGYGEFGYSEYGYGELELLVGLFSSWRSVLRLVWSLGSKALGRARARGFMARFGGFGANWVIGTGTGGESGVG